MSWHGGKGSGRRSGADDKKYAEGWDKIFKSKSPLNSQGGVRRREKKDITK